MNIDRITADANICTGKPTVRGTRITVEFVLKLLGNGYTVDDIVLAYPELYEADVHQCAAYGAWLASENWASFGI